MNKKILAVLTGVGLLLTSQAQAAANVEVTWENPKEYTDVKPSNESRKHFRKRVFKQLDNHFVELAEKLPDGQTLQVTVTDLDLAGQVWPASFVGFGNSGSDVRLIKRIDIPRMTFSYKLLDADKNVIQESSEVKIKDMGFQDRLTSSFRDEPFRYEKQMIKDWFNDEFPELIAKN